MLKLLYFNAFGSDAHLGSVELDLLTYFCECLVPVELFEDFVSIHLLAVGAGAKTEVAILQDQRGRLILN